VHGLGNAHLCRGVLVAQRSHELLEEEGVAIRPGQDGRDGSRLDGTAAQHRFDELAAGLDGQRRQSNLGRVRPAGPRQLIARPRGAHEQDPRPSNDFCERGEELLRGPVNPVQVLDHDDKGLALLLAKQELLQRLERPVLHASGQPLRRPRSALTE
jgi:hypothetical protein